MIEIEVVYATSKTLFRKILSLPDGTLAQEVLSYLDDWPSLEWKSMPMGVFSKRINLTTPLKDGDRLEIYRPLEISPMDKRRKLALKTK